MGLQYSGAIRDNQNNQINGVIGAIPILKIFSGAVPGSCAAGDPGGLLATLTLPNTWINPSAGGILTQAGGPWTGLASSNGTASSFRIYDPTGTTCHLQGTVTPIGQGGDLQLTAVGVTTGLTISINNFSITRANA
jgi:hypothetical protein